MSKKLKQISACVVLAMLASTGSADDVSGADRLLCTSLEAAVCASGGGCVTMLPEELNVPLFVQVDVKKRKLSATEASGTKRVTVADSVKRVDGQLILNGYENGRAFSMLIHEESGYASFVSASELQSTVVFGACTPL